MNTIDGDFLCVQSFDCSEDELIEIVEDIMEDKNDLYFNDMDDGQWNFD